MVWAKKMNTVQTHGFQAKSKDNLKDKKIYSMAVNKYYKKHTAQKSGYYKI
jgi:hypothetical protein